MFRVAWEQLPGLYLEGQEIYGKRLPASEALQRISKVYRPYHAALQSLIAHTHVKFGMAILLDVHSMPSMGTFPNSENRGDIVLGDRFGSSCDPRILHEAKAIFKELGYQVEINKPYAGGFITEHYGRPLSGLHALQIEINRSLYMDELHIDRNDQFDELSQDFNAFFHAFAQMDMQGLEGSQPLAAE